MPIQLVRLHLQKVRLYIQLVMLYFQLARLPLQLVLLPLRLVRLPLELVRLSLQIRSYSPISQVSSSTSGANSSIRKDSYFISEASLWNRETASSISEATTSIGYDSMTLYTNRVATNVINYLKTCTQFTYFYVDLGRSRGFIKNEPSAEVRKVYKTRIWFRGRFDSFY